MSNVINFNLDAAIAQRHLATATERSSRSIERLASGLRINRASDDPAGLAISSGMGAQLSAMRRSIQNAQDGTSLLQTAQGALEQHGTVLTRIAELAAQSQNGTNTDANRATMQAEVAQLLAQLDQIANNTDFNGRRLLDGSSTVAVSATNGTGSVTNLSGTADTQTGALALTVALATSKSATSSTALATTATAFTQASSITLNGYKFDFGTGNTVQQALDAMNAVSAQTGVTVGFTAGAPSSFNFSATVAGTAPTFAVASNTGDFGAIAAGAAAVDAAVTAPALPTGVSQVAGLGNTVRFSVASTATGAALTYKGLQFDVATAGTVSVNVGVNRAISLQVGPNASQTIGVSIASATTAALGINAIDISTVAGANAAKTLVDTAVTNVNSRRAALGALESRAQFAIASLRVGAENLAAARSRIQDLDVAAETVELTRTQILRTAGIAVLAQANQAPQQVLQLLR